MEKLISKFYIIGLLLLAIAVLPVIAMAKQLRFEVSVDRNVVVLGQSLQLSLQFNGTRDVPEPELSDLEGFSARYIGPSTRMSYVNGRMTSSITHIYRLVPLKTGTFKIGPLSFKHKRDSYISKALTIEVVDSSSAGAMPKQGRQGSGVSLKDRLFVKIEAGKTRGYINEVIPLSIKLYVSGLSVRDIQHPEINHEGFSVSKFGDPLQYKKNINGVAYNVIEFRMKIFGTRPGEFTIGPAGIKANLLLRSQRGRPSSRFDNFFGDDTFDGFFGGYSTEPVDLKSEKTVMTIMPLPTEERPAGFKGAVGDFDLTVEVSTEEVTAGDPVTLKMTVSGIGNLNTVTRPVLKNEKGFKIYEPLVNQEENKKVFEQVLIPADADIKEIPGLSFSFFDASEGKYKTLTEGPFGLKVKKAGEKDKSTIIESAGKAKQPLIEEELGKDIIYIKDSPGRLRKKGDYLYKNIYFIMLNLLPLLALLVLSLYQKKREKLSSDRGYARRLSAPKKAKKGIAEAAAALDENMTGQFYDAVFGTLRDYIGNRFHLPSGGLTADSIDEMPEMKNIDEEIRSILKRIFRECDIARYAPSSLGTGEMERTIKDLKESIDHLERHR